MGQQSGSHSWGSRIGFLYSFRCLAFAPGLCPFELIEAGIEAKPVESGTPGYSTTNYLILQLVAEEIEGRPLADSIAERITKPLDMNGTALPDPFTQGHLDSASRSSHTTAPRESRRTPTRRTGVSPTLRVAAG